MASRRNDLIGTLQNPEKTLVLQVTNRMNVKESSGNFGIVAVLSLFDCKVYEPACWRPRGVRSVALVGGSGWRARHSWSAKRWIQTFDVRIKGGIRLDLERSCVHSNSENVRPFVASRLLDNMRVRPGRSDPFCRTCGCFLR